MNRYWRLLHPTTTTFRRSFSSRIFPSSSSTNFIRRNQILFSSIRCITSERERLLNRLNSKTITEHEVRTLIENNSNENDPSIRSMNQSTFSEYDYEASMMASSGRGSFRGNGSFGSRDNPLYTRRVTGWKDVILSLFPLVFIFWAFGGFEMIKMRRAAAGAGGDGKSAGAGTGGLGGGAGGGLPGSMFGKNFTEWTETDWEDEEDDENEMIENEDDEVSDNPLDPRGYIHDPRDDFFARLGISMDGKRVPARLGVQSKKKNSKNSKKDRRKRKRTRFSDVCGNEEAKIDMMDLVDYLKNPHKYTEMGCKLPKGVLLYGAPGTGKTLLARALAGEAGVPFLSCNGASFDEIFVGVGVQRVRKLFERAKEIAPCIIFIDEIDAIANTRMSMGTAHSSDSLNALLSELDGFDALSDDKKGVVVVAATNMVDRLDPALVRPGRFDRKIKVQLPDKQARKAIVNLYLQKLKRSKVNPDIYDRLDELVSDIHGFSGAELENMVNIASIEAVKNDQERLEYVNLLEAKEQIGMGRARQNLKMTEEQLKLTAYHESGHAIVSLFTKGSKEIYKATILPRGDALGYVASTQKDEYMNTKESLLSHLDMCMGGRLAEEMIFGKDHITTGASSDFAQATNMATAMVIHYGMSEKVGNVFYQKDDVSKLSPDLQNLINSEIKRLLDESEARARKLLNEHENELHTLANELLEKETLSGDDIKRILGLNGNDTSLGDGNLGSASSVSKKASLSSSSSSRRSGRRSSSTTGVDGGAMVPAV